MNDPKDYLNNADYNNSNAILIAKDVTKTWPTASGPLHVLKGINLTLNEGESVAIIGPSGSGKSTLLSILGTLDRQTSGSIIIGGTNTSALSDEELARWRGKSLGIIFQQFHLMASLSALENVALPLEIAGNKSARNLAKEALHEVGLSERLNHLPNMLSGGENQRVAIARALVTRPKLLLADEPSGSLDPETGQLISDLLFGLAHKHRMSMILVTHNIELARRCQRQLTMQNGILQ